MKGEKGGGVGGVPLGGTGRDEHCAGLDLADWVKEEGLEVGEGEGGETEEECTTDGSDMGKKDGSSEERKKGEGEKETEVWTVSRWA